MTTDVVAKLAYSRKELLDLGLRNPLINYRVRANKIEAVDVTDVFLARRCQERRDQYREFATGRQHCGFPKS